MNAQLLLVGEARIVDAIDSGVGVEQIGDFLRVGLLAIKAEGQCLRTPQQKEAVEWRQPCTFAVLDEVELVANLFVVDDDGTSHDVAVAAKELRRRVQDDVSPECEWAL